MNLDSFKKHVLPLNKKLFHYAYLLLKNRSEAEDAVQEVCLKLWKIRDSLENFNSIEAFAIKVTRNWCLDRIKAKKPLYVENYLSWSEQDSGVSDPYRSLEQEEHWNMLLRVLDQLPEQQRMIVHLRDIEGLEFEEIAEIMDMNINAIRVTLSRARTKIKEELTRYE
jgi:RNA polymerase sigma factor (sigma-70 family)